MNSEPRPRRRVNLRIERPGALVSFVLLLGALLLAVLAVPNPYRPSWPEPRKMTDDSIRDLSHRDTKKPAPDSSSARGLFVPATR